MDFYVWLQHICPKAGPAARNAAGVGPVGSRRRDTRGEADSPGDRACETRLPTNTKTPASLGDAGVLDRVRCVFPGEARPASTPIRVTMVCVVSRAVVLIRLTRFRSMLCLGRNLITVFQGVNTWPQLFFIPPAACVGGDRCRRTPPTAVDVVVHRASEKHA